MTGDDGSARYLDALARRWPILVALIVISVSSALAYSLLAAKRYKAQADVLVSATPVTGDATFAVGLLRDPSSSIYTAGRLVKSPRITVDAARRLGEPVGDPEQILKLIEVEPITQSSVLAIRGKASSPARAALIANTFAQVLIEQVGREFQSELQATLERLRSRLRAIQEDKTAAAEVLALQASLARLEPLVGTGDPTLKLLDHAVPPDNPVWPRPVLSAGLAFFAALILGVGLLAVLEALSPRLTNEEALDAEPVLARIPRGRESLVRNYLRGRNALPSDFWEAYRTLRANLADRSASGRFPRTLLITSAIRGEGKTMTSANLAITLAAAGARVILVDGDLRRPMVGNVFATKPGPGSLAAVLLGRIDPVDALVPAPGYGEGLRLLLSGSERPVDLLDPPRIASLLEQLSREADVVILDSSPLTEFADSFALADAVDSVVVVTRLGHTRRDRYGQLRRFLAQNRIVPTGFVLTTLERSQGVAKPPPQEEFPGLAAAEKTGEVTVFPAVLDRKS
jgi:capsular exopolysaccharide synthesis family protein